MYSAQTPFSENQSFVISFSVEELTLITAAMKLPAFLGFRPPEPLPLAAAQAGERSLRLRGLAGVDENGKFIVSSELARLLSVCAVPDMMLVIGPSFNMPDGYFIKTYDETSVQKFFFFCVHGNDMVFHNRTLPGVHTFMALTSPDMVRTLTALGLGLSDVDAAPNAVDSFRFTMDEYAAVEQASREADAVTRLMSEFSLPESLAQTLASQRKHMLALIWRNDWQQPGYAYTDETLLEQSGYYVMLAPEGGIWVIYPEGEQTMVMMPANAADFIDSVLDDLHQMMGIA
jgi:hypothetical protein